MSLQQDMDNEQQQQSSQLALAAKQYRDMGAEIAVIADTTPFLAKAAALPPSIRTSERTRASTFFIAILLCKFVILLTAAKEILCIRR